MSKQLDKLDGQTLLHEFYSWLKENHDVELSLNQVKEIIDAPFQMLRRIMNEGKFVSVRFQSFGLFFVYPKKVKYQMLDLKNRYEKGTISHNTYVKYYKLFKSYLDGQEEIEGKKAN